MTEEKLDIIKGSSNVFRDVGLPDPDTELLKAELATAIIRAQREQKLTNAAAADRAGVDERDISRIRHCKLDRFTIDRLARIARSLDPQVHLVVARTPQPKAARG